MCETRNHTHPDLSAIFWRRCATATCTMHPMRSHAKYDGNRMNFFVTAFGASVHSLKRAKLLPRRRMNVDYIFKTKPVGATLSKRQSFGDINGRALRPTVLVVRQKSVATDCTGCTTEECGDRPHWLHDGRAWRPTVLVVRRKSGATDCTGCTTWKVTELSDFLSYQAPS